LGNLLHAFRVEFAGRAKILGGWRTDNDLLRDRILVCLDKSIIKVSTELREIKPTSITTY